MTVQKNEKGQTLNEATSALLAERKLFGQILYDDLSAQIAIPFELDAEGMDKLIQKFDAVAFTHVKRERNTIADREANKAIDRHFGLNK